MEKDLVKFYKGKRVLITGHTGFKGTWLSHILLKMGAIVTGYSLNPPTEPSLFAISGVEEHLDFTSIIGDIRDLEHLKSVFRQSQPEIVLHLAAQPIVRDSYKDPVSTYDINVMGTVNVLECIRIFSYGAVQNSSLHWEGVRSFVNITTDKVYKNNEWYWGYRETDMLDGYDPYSNSKSCSELVTHSFKCSFFRNDNVRISSVRAGNVLGGGDFANDRIIPDCVRKINDAFMNGSDKAVLSVRNPYSIRPYQHVLEPLMMYLTIAMMQYEDAAYAGCYNIGPDDSDCVVTGKLVDIFCNKWNEAAEAEKLPVAQWAYQAEKGAPHEANFLKLDCSKIKSMFNYRPKWHIDKCIQTTVEFYKVWLTCKASGDYRKIGIEMNREIDEYMKEQKS